MTRSGPPPIAFWNPKATPNDLFQNIHDRLAHMEKLMADIIEATDPIRCEGCKKKLWLIKKVEKRLDPQIGMHQGPWEDKPKEPR